MSPEQNIASAYADEMRRRIILLLRNSRLCVSCLVKTLDAPQSTVSRHLALLKGTGGVVAKARSGTYSYYRLDYEGEWGRLKESMADIFSRELAAHEPYRSDVNRLHQLARKCQLDCEVEAAPAQNT